MDMDGVLVREEHAIEGADRFLTRLRELGRPFMLLTNNSIYTPRDLAARLRASGIDVPESSILTSALSRCLSRRSGRRRWPPRASSPTSGRAAPRTWWGRRG